MTKNLDIDPDTISTIPIDKIAVLHADALAAIAAYEAIDDWFSTEGRVACREKILACAAFNAELERLATDSKTRHRNWRSRFNVELMALGYI